MKVRSCSIAATLLSAFVITSVAVPAHAQVQELVIPAGNDWAHQWTAMEFPASIGNFQRTGITQFEERQTNVAASYADPKTETILTLYLYRPALPDASIWFDRALVAIGAQDVLGRADVDNLKLSSFIPSGGSAQSGQYAAIKVSGNFRSTGVAIYRAGDWLVKMRISSRKLKVRELERMITSTLSQMSPLADVAETPAYIIAPCATVMQFSDADAIEPDDAQNSAISAALGALSITNSEDAAIGDKAETTPTYCREGARDQRGNLYRPDASETEYLIALNDAGFSMEVTPQVWLAALLPNEDSSTATYQVKSATGLKTDIHTAYSGMPTPQQVLKSVFDEPVLASINRPFGDKETRIETRPGPETAEGEQ